MASHSSTLAWKIPWTEEPSRLQSMGSWRVGHNWTTSLSLFTFMHWRRKWQPTPVFLPGESQGLGSLVGCRLWGCTKLDTTEVTWQQQQQVEKTWVWSLGWEDPRRRKEQLTPIFLPEKSHGQRSLSHSYTPKGHKESDTIEWLSTGSQGKNLK